jgi:hypothetical protein
MAARRRTIDLAGSLLLKKRQPSVIICCIFEQSVNRTMCSFQDWSKTLE